MSNITTYTPPNLAQLVADPQGALKQDALNYFLNQDPPETWVKTNPFANDSKYLPIDKVDVLLRSIFKRYRVEITGQGQTFNGVWVTVRLSVLNPITNEWDWHDGIGASEVQVKSGSSPADLANINRGALSMAYPKAETEAIKDAAHKFGRIFGADLNRKDLVPNKPDGKLVTATQSRALTLIAQASSLEKLEEVFTDASAFGDFEEAYAIRKEQLKANKPTRTRRPKVNPHK